MKILFLANIPSPYRVSFFQELGKTCQLTVLYEKKAATDRDAKWQLTLEEKSYQEVYMKQTIALSSSALCLDVIKYLKTVTYDIVVVGVYSTPTGMLAIRYLKRNKKTFVINCDGGFIRPDNYIKFRFKKYFLGSAQWWLSPGELSDEYLVHYGAIKEKIFRYPFSSIREADILQTPDYEKKAELKKTLKIQQPKMILAVGQFIERKGFDVLIKAMKNLSDDVCVIIIGGEPTGEYLSLQKELGLKNLYMLPFCEPEKLAQYYMAADLFVLPTREDIWGLVINEAMAYGLPVITTQKCMAGLELVSQGENGYILPVDQVEELSRHMKLILGDETMQKEMGAKSLSNIRAYTIEKMAARHGEIFENMIREWEK